MSAGPRDPRRDRDRHARPVSHRSRHREQKGRHLGPMLHGDEVWCQMFSEPAAGSDLAAVQTRARQNDDGSWTLNGQKVWTTNAQFASFGLLLARTDSDVPSTRVTMLIVPMDARGVVAAASDRSPARPSSTRCSSTRSCWTRTRSSAASATAGAPLDRADVRAADDRVRVRGLRLAARRRRRWPPTPPRARTLTPPPAGRHHRELLAVGFNGYRALTLAGGRSPVRRRAREGDDGRRRDRRHRPRRRHARPDALGRSQWSYLISFLPGLKSAGGTEQIFRNTIGERCRIPVGAATRRASRSSELRAKEKGAVAR